jgi:nucleoside-diphosphate-sugar epimerase
MRIFVTGASGFVGSSVLPELRQAGHRVSGLARSDAAAEKVAALGATVVRGSLDDLDVLAAAAHESDGIIHLAFDHEVAFGGDFAAATASCGKAIEIFGTALAGKNGRLVLASGLVGLTSGKVTTERDGGPKDGAAPSGSASPRLANVTATLALAAQGVRSSVIRLAPTVHGRGDHGFVAILIDAARRNGRAAYVGNGANRWPALHVRDAGRLFRLAVESAPPASILHGVGEEGVALKEIATVIGRHLTLPVTSITADEAASEFGFLSRFVSLDSPASYALTRELLDWTPIGLGLLADLELGHYFESPTA